MSDKSPPGQHGHMLALPPGYMLESYRIERVLGEGGFGITYLAEDVHSTRQVAVKELLPRDIATRTRGSTVIPSRGDLGEAFQWALDSFMKEARHLAKLSHPNIVQIHRLFPANGTAYMVMDYVEGQSLRHWLKAHPQPSEAELRAILMPLLDGLEHVHEAGLLHRDIKPDNIFLTAKGKPVLLDFGSARVDAGKTQTMTSMVSKGYSPFELYTTRSRQTPATDLYALAATMVHAVTGKAPEDATDRIADPTGTHPVSETEKGRYSPFFLQAVDAAFAVHAAERPQSVAAWRQMLEDLPMVSATTRTGATARTSGAPSRVRSGPTAPLKRERKGWLAAAAACLLSVGIGAGVYVMMGGGEEGKDGGSPSEPVTTPVGVPVVESVPVPSPGEPPPAGPVAQPSPAAPTARPIVMPDRKIPFDRAHPLTEPPRIPSPELVAAVEPKVGDTKVVILPDGIKLVFCWCPPGQFVIGSPASEMGRREDEHQVPAVISRGYWLARTEVTQEQWEAVMGNNPSYFRGKDLPVEMVSWEDAEAFIEKVNQIGSLPDTWKLALPTEAQWEYACRAGTNTAFSFGDVLNGKEANCDGNYPYGTATKGPYLDKTSVVGSYRANAWGLHDMHGNVWEWCADWYGSETDLRGSTTGVSRVRRGGSWRGNAASCRAAILLRNGPGFRYDGLGFRPALVHIESSPVKPDAAPAPTAPARPLVPASPAPMRMVDPKAGDTMSVILPSGEKMVLCYCPPGSFTMGSLASEEGRGKDENQVSVTINRGFWLARTEVTQGQWEAVMESTVQQQMAKTSNFKDLEGVGPNHPMYFVNWDESQAFVDKLNLAAELPTGWKWVLPSEAQWEYACRAETRTAFSFGHSLTSKDANIRESYLSSTGKKSSSLGESSEVGLYPANAWGLHDMHGNVEEWCFDLYEDKFAGGNDPLGASRGAFRVRRGGSWLSRANECRAAFRYRSVPSVRNIMVGFRPALIPRP